MSRFVLVSKVVEAELVRRALIIDLMVAVFIAVLIRLVCAIHIVASAFINFLFTLFHIVNMEMAAALDTVINIADIWCVSDIQFIQGSLSNLTFPWYTFFLLISTIVYLVATARVTKNKPVKMKYFFLYAFLSIFILSILSPGGTEWQSSNLMWLSVTKSIQSLISQTKYSSAMISHADVLGPIHPEPNIDNISYFRKPRDANRNILFVVLEGIPGVYVRQVQEWTGVKYQVEMPNLSHIAESSLIIPNFIAHNRQTIRGLYSLLSGDYCKLSLKTPKIYEYIILPQESRKQCLPEILSDAGYTTVYLQAADTAYMSKDQFMPAAGFEQVFGKEFFRYQYVSFNWGPDDMAFFEQAAEYIEDLNQKSDLWFLTLLTVGTHHPYAVPKELANKFSSRKEAAVAYLDQAIGDFFKQLDDAGILDNTLVLFVSDESHGVTGQPYGNNWGLAVAYAPESFGTINPAVFGLIDIPYSILDYLDLTKLPHSFPKRSIFREQNRERSILFESYVSEEKGVVKKRINNKSIEVFESANGEIFSRSYERMIVDGENGRKLSETLRQYQSAADSSLSDIERKDRRYVFLENDEYVINKLEHKLLSSGQYLDITGRTTVTVELKATVQFNENDRLHVNTESIRLVLQMIKRYEKMQIPEIRIPVLKDGDSLELSFSFYTKESLSRVWAYLNAISVNPSCSTRLHIERFSIEMREDKLRDDFQINRFFIKEKDGKIQDLSPTISYFEEDIEKNISIHQLGSGFSRNPEVPVWTNTFWKGQNDPDTLELIDDQSVPGITFTTGKLEQRYDRYMILIDLRILKGNYAFPEIQVSLNERFVKYRWFDYGTKNIKVVVLCHRTALEECGVNTISLKVNKNITDTGIIDLSGNGEFMDFEPVKLVIQPSPSPVAHAGGAYKGLTYTNSLEALEENIDTFLFSEIDFEWTEDKQLVGLHDWDDIFEKLFGFGVERPLDFNTFYKLGKGLDITPLNLDLIKAYLYKHPYAKIITDVKSNNIDALKKIAEFFPDYAERFIPQVYNPDEFVEALEIGYTDIIWTLYQYQHLYEPDKILSYISCWEEKYKIKPFAITMPVPAVKRGIAQAISEAGIPIYVHTINSCDDYFYLLFQGISSIYTDFLDVENCYTLTDPFLTVNIPGSFS